MHCLGCPASRGETIAEACEVHGVDCDVLLVDAFAGDAIPTHLVTREAVALSLSRVSPRGLLVFHVSNRFYDLRPVLATAARDLGLSPRVMHYKINGLGIKADWYRK